MTRPLCSFIDLEGVLVPEMWPHLAAQFGIVELAATTREIPDYRYLMDRRISALARHRITLKDVCSAVATLEPFEGAYDFIRTLRDRGRVVIVSDSFRPMNRHFLDALSVDLVLCHSFETDKGGLIERLRFWNDLGGKHLCYDALDLDGHRTFAMGDAFNDLSMIRAASTGVLFRASAATRAASSDLRTVSTYHEALSALEEDGGIWPTGERPTIS